MNLYEDTAIALRYGVILSVIVIVIGLIADALDHGQDILWLGILILILSPMFGIAVSFVCLATEKDWKWASAAAVLLAVVSAGIVVALIV